MRTSRTRLDKDGLGLDTYGEMAKRDVDRELDHFLDRHGYHHSRRRVRGAATPVAVPPPLPKLLEDPVAVVRRTAEEMGSGGRFHSKVYIAAIWDAAADQLGMSLPEFKRWLIEQNRRGTLLLARGDLVGAMDRQLLARSEIQDRGATFHFVMDPSRSF